jgi:signal recognition particle subunit SRP54
VLLVAADVYRPAAIDQLKTLGSRINVDVFTLGTDADPVAIAKQGIEMAKADGYTTVRTHTLTVYIH